MSTFAIKAAVFSFFALGLMNFAAAEDAETIMAEIKTLETTLDQLYKSNGTLKEIRLVRIKLEDRRDALEAVLEGQTEAGSGFSYIEGLLKETFSEVGPLKMAEVFNDRYAGKVVKLQGTIHADRRHFNDTASRYIPKPKWLIVIGPEGSPGYFDSSWYKYGSEIYGQALKKYYSLKNVRNVGHDLYDPIAAEIDFEYMSKYGPTVMYDSKSMKIRLYVRLNIEDAIRDYDFSKLAGMNGKVVTIEGVIPNIFDEKKCQRCVGDFGEDYADIKVQPHIRELFLEDWIITD